MSGIKTLKCFNCGKPVEYADRVGFRDECQACHADARVCKNCRFYDAKAYNECRETSADVVMVKDRSNRCDFFQPNDGSGGSVSSEKDALLSAAEALFKK